MPGLSFPSLPPLVPQLRAGLGRLGPQASTISPAAFPTTQGKATHAIYAYKNQLPTLRRWRSDSRIELPPLSKGKPSSPSENPYPDWNLQTVIQNHPNRFQEFIKKGGFANPESAERFLEIIQALAKNAAPAEITIDALRAVFQTFPEAHAYEETKSGVNTNIVQQILETLQSPDSPHVLFPNGREQPDSLIDIGCGKGAQTSSLAESWGLSPENAIGLDIVEPDSLPGNITFKKMLPDALPETIQPNSQDLATISMVCHHSSDPRALLKSVHSVLKPGGYLIIREHNADDRLADFLNTVHIFYGNVFDGKKTHMPNVQNYKSLEAWKMICKEQGFDHIKTNYIPFSTDPMAGNPKNTGENFAFALKKKRFSSP